MRKIIKIIGREEILVVGMIFCILGLALTTTIYEVFSFSNLPPERVAVLEHNWTYDFNVYLTKMMQGKQGGWLVYNKYTSEPHGGSLLHEFYLLLGRLGGFLGLSMPVTYFLARLILSFAFFYSLYYLLSQLIRDKRLRLLAFFLSCFATQLPKLTPYSGKSGFDIGFWVPWWTGGDQLQEAAFLPHYVLGHILMFLMLLVFWRMGKGQITWLKGGVMAGILGWIAGMIHPPSLLIIYPTVIFCGAWKFLRGDFSLRRAKSFLVFLFLSLPSLIYVFWASGRFPWQSLGEETNFLLRISFWELMMTTGGVFFLGMAGLVLVLWKKKEELYPFVFWILSVIFLGFFVSRLGIFAQLRAFQTFHRVAFAVLTAYFLSLIGKRWGWWVVWFVVAVLMVFSAISFQRSILGWKRFIDSRIYAGVPLVPAPPTIMYPLGDFMKAIYFIRDNSKPSDVVLSGFTAGNYIPAYAGNTVYFGHNETVNFGSKEWMVARFFGKQMSKEEGESFLRENRIKYIFFGPQEKEMGGETFYNWSASSAGSPASPRLPQAAGRPIFEKVFGSEFVDVYRIMNNEL
jgi:hypothetical protein